MRRTLYAVAVAALALTAVGPGSAHMLKRESGERQHVYYERLAHHGKTAVVWADNHEHLYRDRRVKLARIVRGHEWLERAFARKAATIRLRLLREELGRPGGVYRVARDEAFRLGVTRIVWGNCLAPLIEREGGWDPFNYNNLGSGAYGLPQALPGEKMASAGPDWEWNPATQVRWMVGYCDRYGGVCAAYHFQLRHGSY